MLGGGVGRVREQNGDVLGGGGVQNRGMLGGRREYRMEVGWGGGRMEVCLVVCTS